MSKIIAPTKWIEMDDSATYLLLISPQNIPHLAIVHKGKHYSLTHKSVILGKDFTPYFGTLKRANKKMVLIQLDVNGKTPFNFFSKYQKANEISVTCFLPVKDYLLTESKANFVYELIPELYIANKIIKTEYINMEDDLDEFGDLNLSIYRKEDIYNYIHSLNQKYVKRG